MGGLSRWFLLDHLMGIPQPYRQLDYRHFKTWHDLQVKIDFKHRRHALIVSGIKAVGLHSMQPCLFFFALSWLRPHHGQVAIFVRDGRRRE